jgi:SAM-dependent methyltransferase
MPASHHGGSPSIHNSDYWWYTARAELLRTVLSSHVDQAARVLDVGSADGPSVGWLQGRGRHTAVDIDIRGLGPGDVCGSATALPFRDGSFDVVAAFDVIEHVDPEHVVVAELRRVLDPGGRLLVSVPAYNWAWSDHDTANGHHRRYTRRRLVDALEQGGFEVDRATYAFAAVFPFFAAERLVRRVKHSVGRRTTAPADVVTLPRTPQVVDRALERLTRLDQRWLEHRNLPMGSSVVAVATKRADPAP